MYKRILSLIIVGSFGCSAFAQEEPVIESYSSVFLNGEGKWVLAPEFEASTTPDENGNLVVEVSTASVSMKAVSGTSYSDIEGKDFPGLTAEDTVKYHFGSWPETLISTASWKVGSHGDANMGWVQGSGNPFVSFTSEAVVNEDVFQDKIRAKYEFYNPDGSLGLPINGAYIEIKTSVDGMLKVPFWANKGGTRSLFIADKDNDNKALLPGTEYKAEGYVNGAKDVNGKILYWLEIPIDENFVLCNGNYDLGYTKIEDDVEKPVIFGGTNQAKIGYFVFDSKADHTYVIFGKDWQFGFGGFIFTPGGRIDEYVPVEPSAIRSATLTVDDGCTYNLQGQKVGVDERGLVIKGGKLRLQK